MSIRALLPWLAIIAMCVACSAGNDRFTPENYAAIEGGMSQAEVLELLGEPDTTQKYRGETMWHYRRGEITAGITFRGDQVIHKGETGLEVGDAEYMNRMGLIESKPTVASP